MKKTRPLHILIIYTVFTAVLLTLLVLYETGNLRRMVFGAKLPREVTYDEFVTLEDPVITDDLLLVNAEHPVGSGRVFDIVFYRDTDVPMNSAIVDSYGMLSDYVRENLGDRLYVSSTYRSFEDQQRVYEEEGADVAALPGCSEHQTGLAVDLYVMYHAGSAFIETPAGRYVNDHAGDYGFIIRYPEGAEDITGFPYEPWHIRYTGLPHSQIIMDNRLTLEEYIDMLVPGRWYACNGYVLGRMPEDDIRVPVSLSGNEMTVSRDNTGHVIITIVS